MLSINEKLSEFEARRRQITYNVELSDQGKAAAYKRLDNEIQAYCPQVLQALRAEWAEIRAGYKRVEQARLEAEAKAAEGWNYDRLAYMSQVVGEAIRKADDPDQLQAAYQGALASGDKHAARAWAELAPRAMAEKFAGKPGAHSLEKRAQADLDRLLTTPELDKVYSQGAELTQRAIKAAEDTNQANRFFYPSDYNAAGQFYGAVNDFSNLMAGVNLQSKVDPATLDTHTTLTVAEPATMA